MNYKFSSESSLNYFSLHDSIIQDLRVIDNNLYLYVNMINVTPKVKENPFDVAKQTDEALIVLKGFKFLHYTKDHGDKFNNETFENYNVEDIKMHIKFGKSYIYDFASVADDDFCRELLLDSLENFLMSVKISYKESVINWNEFVKDSWFVRSEKRNGGKKINKLKEIHKYEKAHLKDYEYKYNYFFLAPFVFVFIIGPLIALAFTIPMAINESEYYFVPIIIWGGILLSMCVVLVPYTKYVKKRLILDQVSELRKSQNLIDVSDAIEHLNSIKDFDANSIYVDREKKVALSEFTFNFYASIEREKIKILLIAFSKEYGEFPFEIDNNLYTYIKHQRLLKGNTIFELFERDIDYFVRLLIKNRSTDRFHVRSNLQTNIERNKNIHSMNYIIELITLLVQKGHEPEIEFYFNNKHYGIVAYETWVDFVECHSATDMKPNYKFENISELFNNVDIEGIDFIRDWKNLDDFRCLDFAIPVEGSEWQKLFSQELAETGKIILK